MHGLPAEASARYSPGGPQVVEGLPADGEAQRGLLEAAHQLRVFTAWLQLCSHGGFLHGRDSKHISRGNQKYVATVIKLPVNALFHYFVIY